MTKTMKHYITKNNEIIAVFEKEEHADMFLEMISGLKINDFSEIRDYFRAVTDKNILEI